MNAKLPVATIAALALATTAVAQQAAEPEHHMTKPTPAFSQLTSLVGMWEGKTTDGKTVNLSFQLGSGGSALIERMSMGTEPEMVTVYHADGDRVAVTHYCSVGNQPVMQTAALNGAPKRYSFEFVRVTNLASPATGHMHHLTVTLVDKDHLTEEWTWQENGQAQAMQFHYTRKS